MWPALAKTCSLDEIRHQFETNFFGNVAMTKAVLPVMRRQKSGHIIQVASVAGRLGQPMLGAYCASKFALEGFSEALRIETHSLGIHVVLVEPGAYDTDIWHRNVVVGKQALRPNFAQQGTQSALRRVRQEWDKNAATLAKLRN